MEDEGSFPLATREMLEGRDGGRGRLFEVERAEGCPSLRGDGSMPSLFSSPSEDSLMVLRGEVMGEGPPKVLGKASLVGAPTTP